MTRVQIGLVAALLGVVYLVSFALRGQLVPGLVGGALAGVLAFLVLARVERQAAVKRRRRERDGRP